MYYSEEFMLLKQNFSFPFSKVGAEQIRRAAAPNDHPLFVRALSEIVSQHLKSNVPLTPKFTMRCPRCTNPRCIESKKWYAALTS